MPSLQTGIAVVFGFKGTVAGAGLTGVASFLNESGDVSSDIKVDEIRNEDNDLVGLIHSGEVFDASLTFTPYGTAGAGVNALTALLKSPTIGGAVVLTNFRSVELNKADWVYVGGWKVAFKKDGVATYELKIKRAANNISTAVSA